MTDQQTTPRADRPHMPGYGVPTGKKGLLPWEHVVQRMEAGRNFWVASATPDGRPHCVPVWGAWLDNIFYFEGGGRKAANLRRNPQVVVHLESGEDVVIVEGVFEELSGPSRDLFCRIDESYAARYPYRPSQHVDPDGDPYPEGGLFAVHPRVVFAWSHFPQDATRWRFDRG